jgi:hypothetical protein
MVDVDIIATDRVGTGYLSTTFSDPSDLAIIYRKWIFGDGIVIEGPNLQTINHTYYNYGNYEVRLIAQTELEQYSVIKKDFIIVNEVVPIPNFIIAQSFDLESGCYWRLYFDLSYHLIFEDNLNIYRSKEKLVRLGKWQFIDINRKNCTMRIGSFSEFYKEIEIVKIDNSNPILVYETKTEILTDSSMKIDDLKIWSVEKDLKEYYKSYRGRAGYLDSL